MPPILTYVLLALCAATFVAGFVVDRKSLHDRSPRIRHVALAAQLLAIVAAYFVLRPGHGDDARARISDSTQHHAPILLDVYSNY